MATFDEMGIASGETRPLYRQVARWLEETPPELLASRRATRKERNRYEQSRAQDIG